MHRRRLVSVVTLALIALTLTACSGSTNPAAPSTPKYTPPYIPPPPTTGVLTVRLDASCAGVRTISADIFLDGQYVGVISAGGAYTASVTIGNHNVEGTAYYIITQTQARHWGPQTVYVTGSGYNELFYCT